MDYFDEAIVRSATMTCFFEGFDRRFTSVVPWTL